MMSILVNQKEQEKFKNHEYSPQNFALNLILLNYLMSSRVETVSLFRNVV